MSSIASDPVTFARLPRSEQLLFLQAWVALPLVVLALRLRGYGPTQRALARVLDRPVDRSPAERDAVVDAAVRMVDAAISRQVVTATCLPRSLVLSVLLRRRGVPCEIVIGVRAGGAPLDAHAWVEVDGRAVGETEAVEGFGRMEPGRAG